MKSLKKSLWMMKWNWKNSYFSLLIFYTVIILLYIFAAVLLTVQSENIQLNGANMSACVMLMILGIVLFSQGIRFGLVNGVSRRSIYGGMAMFSVVLTLLMTAVDTLLSALFNSVSSGIMNTFELLYPGFIESHSAFQNILSVILASLAFNLLATILGFFIGAIYYRMNKVVKMVVSIGVPAFFVMVLPMGFMLLPESVQASIFEFIGNVGVTLFATPYTFALTFLGISVILGFFIWLLIRRAPAKTVSW